MVCHAPKKGRFFTLSIIPVPSKSMFSVVFYTFNHPRSFKIHVSTSSIQKRQNYIALWYGPLLGVEVGSTSPYTISVSCALPDLANMYTGFT